MIKEKRCLTCDTIKSIESFRKDANCKTGYRNQCKACRSIYNIDNRLKNIEYHREYRRSWNAKNRDSINKRNKEWRSNNIHKKDIINTCQKCNNKFKAKNNKQLYCSSECRKDYHRYRCSIDINYKIACALRIRLNESIKGKNKKGSAVRDLGCSVKELKNYLESKWLPEMSWANHGLYGWHMDHIRPLSSFDLEDREELLKACHYTNLQPLWAKDNLRKGIKNV